MRSNTKYLGERKGSAPVTRTHHPGKHPYSTQVMSLKQARRIYRAQGRREFMNAADWLRCLHLPFSATQYAFGEWVERNRIRLYEEVVR